MQPKVGDWVRVKPGVKDFDFPQFEMTGWEGRIMEVEKDRSPPMYCVKWSQKTRSGFPKKLMKLVEKEGLCLSKMCLFADYFDIIEKPKDEPEIEDDEWDYGFSPEQNARIAAVIKGIDRDDEDEIFSAWEKYLRSKIAFPFEAVVTPDHEEEDDLVPGDTVKVTGIEDVDDLYGILVNAKKGRMDFVFPLCDLEVKDKKSSNFEPVKDYVVWFANR